MNINYDGLGATQVRVPAGVATSVGEVTEPLLSAALLRLKEENKGFNQLLDTLWGSILRLHKDMNPQVDQRNTIEPQLPGDDLVAQINSELSKYSDHLTSLERAVRRMNTII